MIEKIIAENLNVTEDSIKDESNFVQDLGADSLNIVELVMAVEEHFDIEIADEDSVNIHTVADLKRYVEEYS